MRKASITCFGASTMTFLYRARPNRSCSRLLDRVLPLDLYVQLVPRLPLGSR